MGIRYYKPTSPGRRNASVSDFAELTDKNKKPEKSLTEPLKKKGGRNNQGFITARHRGGGHKRMYRIIDWKRNDRDGQPATVTHIEYDPNRSARIALIQYEDGVKRYIIAPAGLNVDTVIVSGPGVAPEVGNALPLREMPLGTIVHNIELQPGQGAAIARSAGTYAQLVAREERYATLKLPSGEMRMVLVTCTATVGTVSNGDHMNVVMGKAGRNRWAGRRPRVRGVAMNPVDHPMGGGEGKSSGGHPRSRNGILAKGQKTRNKNKYSENLIVSRKGKK
jgi:large subunit ribosomal protein L2